MSSTKNAKGEQVTLPTNHPSADLTAEGLAQDFLWNMRFSLAKSDNRATERDCYKALALAVRDRIVDRWMATQDAYRAAKVRRVYYMSLEFLIGRLLGNNVINLGLEEQCREAMDSLGLDWNRLRDYEMDAGLGNGGLGRLAACYLDGLATDGYPATGYSILYEYGIFCQTVLDFLIIALTIFWAVRLVCKLRVKKEEPAPPPPAPAPTPEDILLLREIRDALKTK